MRYSDAMLEPARLRQDSVADACVATLFADAKQVASVNRLFHNLIGNDHGVDSSAPPLVKRYFEETAALPPWASLERVRRGQEVFRKHGPLVILALHLASLPECYAARKGAQVLALTRRMSQEPDKRIMETAQFVIDVMGPGGLEPGGEGVRTAQKVRLVHAAIRHHVHRYPHWDSSWGQPINQEDLVGTLMSFSVVVLDALLKLGVELTAAEEGDYVHAWAVVGHLLGIEDELLPGDPAEARALMAEIRRRQHAASPEGVELTQALVRHVEYHVPGRLFDSVVPTLMRHLLGSHVASLLEVEEPSWTEALMGPLRRLVGLADGLSDQSEWLARVAGQLSHYALYGFLLASRGGERVPFRIPLSLAESWGVSSAPKSP
jgi:hypothetical protein